MKKLSTYVFLLVVAVIVGLVIFVTSWDIPAPANNIERTIPDDNFPK